MQPSTHDTLFVKYHSLGFFAGLLDTPIVLDTDSELLQEYYMAGYELGKEQRIEAWPEEK